MSAIEKLRPICGEMHASFALPFAIEIDGVRYVCATDGFRLAAIVSAEEADACRPALAGSVSDIIRQSYNGHVIPLDGLREWVGVAPELPPCAKCEGKGWVKCRECNGTGDVEIECDHCDEVHDCVCRDCDDGEADCDCGRRGRAKQRPGKVGPAIIDRNLLRAGLDLFGAEASIGFTGETDPVSLRSDGTIFVLMPMLDWGSCPESEQTTFRTAEVHL